MSVKKDIILITGSNGLLGQELRILLEKNDYNIIATGLGRDRLLDHNHTYLELDISSSLRCNDLLNEYSPSVIINAAACTNVDQCEIDQDHCLAVNAHSLNNFLPYVKANKPHFIQVSTDFVFDGLAGNYSEIDHCNPVNFYGFSKLEAERFLKNATLNHTIVRTSLIYGLCGSNFLTRIKNQLESGADLNIVSDQHRTPTYVFDLALLILKIIQIKKYGIYHISSGENLSIFQIVCNIAEYLNTDSSKINKVKTVELNQIASRPANSSLDISKAVRDLDFKPTTLNNALSKIL